MSARLLSLICRRRSCGILHICMYVSNFRFLFDHGSYCIKAPSSSSLLIICAMTVFPNKVMF